MKWFIQNYKSFNESGNNIDLLNRKNQQKTDDPGFLFYKKNSNFNPFNSTNIDGLTKYLFF